MIKVLCVLCIFSVISCMVDRTQMKYPVTVITIPYEADIEYNDSLIGKSPCKFQANVLMARGCCSFAYKPINGEHYLTAYTTSGEQLGKILILTNDNLLKSNLPLCLYLEPMTAVEIESTKMSISKILKTGGYLQPKIFFDLFNVGIYYGYHEGRMLDDPMRTWEFIDGLHASLGIAGGDIRYFFYNRWGMGFTLWENVETYQYGHSFSIFDAIATVNVSYVFYIDDDKFQLLTFKMMPWPADGWSCALEHSFVFFAPWSIECRSRIGFTDWEYYHNGWQIATGLRIGFGRWWLKN